jgi:[acyl-carrier-protein] S-malonyltransferase
VEIIETGESILGFSLRDVLAQPDAMFRNAVAQPLICLTQLAVWTALRPFSPRPAAFCGYSVGELGAYACAGSLDAAELARLAAVRAALMNQAAARQPGGMLAVQGISRVQVENMCEGKRAWIAIAIDTEEFVIGGDNDALQLLDASLSARGARLTPLRVDVASHTPLLSDAAPPFRTELIASSLTGPGTPVVAGIDAAWVVRKEDAIDKLAQQLGHTIEWGTCLDMLHERGCRTFLELGPGRALARMTQARFRDVDARSAEDFRSVEGISAWLEKNASGF